MRMMMTEARPEKDSKISGMGIGLSSFAVYAGKRTSRA